MLALDGLACCVNSQTTRGLRLHLNSNITLKYVSVSFQQLLVKQRNVIFLRTVCWCLVFRFGWQS